ncbi:MAG: hypothetical protein V1870_04325, partial [Candidatus Aenigmatarchaeota archaeon]
MLNRKTLNIISALFYPTNPAIPLIIIFSLNNLSDMFFGILLISIIPLLLVIYYVKKMNIDIDIFEKEHRTMPYIIVILFFALA